MPFILLVLAEKNKHTGITICKKIKNNAFVTSGVKPVAMFVLLTLQANCADIEEFHRFLSRCRGSMSPLGMRTFWALKPANISKVGKDSFGEVQIPPSH